MKKWLSILSRPAFESANPDKRAQAVASDPSGELLSRLPDLARHDNDAQVRMAALRRIDDLSLLADRARLDAHAEVRNLARGRLRQLMLDPATDIQQRQRQLRVLEDPELLEEIARQAEPTDLRRAALERINRPGLLLERCQKDRDPVLRLELLARIDDPAALERLSESSRKTDKQLARAARDKLAGLRLAQGDIEAIRTRADTICRDLESWLRSLPADLAERLQQAEQHWAGLAERLDAGSRQRFAGLLHTLRHMQMAANRPRIDPTEAAAAATVAAETPGVEAEPTSIDPTPAVTTPSVTEVDHAAFERFVNDTVTSQPAHAAALDAVRARLRGEFAAAMDAPGQDLARARLLTWLDTETARLAEQEKQHQQQMQAWQSAVSRYAEAVEAGQIQQARTARVRVLALGADLAKRPATAEQRRLDEVEQAFDKLTRWQRWSNNSQRKRLCEQIEASIGSGEHPDALLTRIKDAQTEWQRLAEMEGEPASDQAYSRLDGRFRALCARAIAPARPYLQKRSALRAEKQSDLALRIDSIDQRFQDGSTDADLFSLARELREAWPLLDALNGRERSRLSERLRQLKSAIDTRIEQERENARSAKQAFIAKLRRQLANLDTAAAIAAARDASVRWKSLTRADRKSEQLLWEELRGLIDPVFAQARGEQHQREAKANADRREQDEILAGLADLLASADGLATLDSESTRLNQRWHALESPSRDDQRRFEQLQSGIERRRADFVAAQADATRSLAVALHHRLCALAAAPAAIEVTALADLRSEIETAAIGSAERGALLQHCAELGPDTEADPATLARQLAVIAIQAELLAGIDSPTNDAALRRELQLQRLAEKLQGRGSSPTESARSLWLEWLALGGHCAERALVDGRIESALAQIPPLP